MKEMRACCVCGSLHPVEELTEFEDSKQILREAHRFLCK